MTTVDNMSIGLHAKGKLYLQSEKTAVKEGMIEDNKKNKRQTLRQKNKLLCRVSKGQMD